MSSNDEIDDAFDAVGEAAAEKAEGVAITTPSAGSLMAREILGDDDLIMAEDEGNSRSVAILVECGKGNDATIENPLSINSGSSNAVLATLTHLSTTPAQHYVPHGAFKVGGNRSHDPAGRSLESSTEDCGNSNESQGYLPVLEATVVSGSEFNSTNNFHSQAQVVQASPMEVTMDSSNDAVLVINRKRARIYLGIFSLLILGVVGLSVALVRKPHSYPPPPAPASGQSPSLNQEHTGTLSYAPSVSHEPSLSYAPAYQANLTTRKPTSSGHNGTNSSGSKPVYTPTS